MVPCCKMENPLSAMWGEVDPETCDQLLKYMALNIYWPESILNHGLQNICWLNKFFAGGLTGCFGAGQLLAYFKFLKIIFNKKKGEIGSGESSPPIFDGRCSGNERCPVRAGLEEARPWGQPMVGASLHLPPMCLAGTGGSKGREAPPVLPASCLVWAGGWKPAAGTLPGDCFGAEWTAAGVFRGLETLPLHRVCLGGGWEGSPPCSGWVGAAGAGGGEARSFPGNYLAPSSGKCNDLKGKLEGGDTH